MSTAAMLQHNVGTVESMPTATHPLSRNDASPTRDVTDVLSQNGENGEVGVRKEDRAGDDETTVVSPDSSGYNSRDSNSPINVCD